MNVQFARRMENVQPSAIRELLRLGADPSIISFGGGYPDASIFPLEHLNEVYEEAIARNAQAMSLAHNHPSGCWRRHFQSHLWIEKYWHTAIPQKGGNEFWTDGNLARPYPGNCTR